MCSSDLNQQELYPSLEDCSLKYGGSKKIDAVKLLWEQGVLTADIDEALLRRHNKMSKLDKPKPYGYGSGDGAGNGYGNGAGAGAGAGDGAGYGAGAGNGSGKGAGNGSGYGYGSGSG